MLVRLIRKMGPVRLAMAAGAISIFNMEGWVSSAPLLACAPQAQEPSPATRDDAPPSPPQPPAASEDASTVAALIKQLDSPSFAEREAATDKLCEYGVTAIEQISNALPDASPEVAVRGVFIISRLASSGKAEAELAARNALELIGGMEGPASQYARTAIGSLDQTIQKRAIEELKRLGAELNYVESRTNTGAVSMAPTGLKIGDQWQGGEKDLRWLQAARGVNRIVLEGDQVSPQWLKHLPRGTSLTSLVLKRIKITDDCVDQIARLSSLVSLDIRYCQFTDDQAMRLAGMQRLERLRILGSQVTERGESALKLALTNATVDVRKGAFLGVQCVAHPLGAAITYVQPGSAAARHGFSANDVIVSYNGEAVRTFEDLTRLISQHSSRREVPIQVARNANVVSTRIQARADREWGVTLKSQILGQEVVEINPKGLANQAGLHKGDILVLVNDQRLDKAEDLPDDGLVEIGFLRNPPQLVSRDVVLGTDESDWGP